MLCESFAVCNLPASHIYQLTALCRLPHITICVHLSSAHLSYIFKLYCAEFCLKSQLCSLLFSQFHCSKSKFVMLEACSEVLRLQTNLFSISKVFVQLVLTINLKHKFYIAEEHAPELASYLRLPSVGFMDKHVLLKQANLTWASLPHISLSTHLSQVSPHLVCFLVCVIFSLYLLS